MSLNTVTHWDRNLNFFSFSQCLVNDSLNSKTFDYPEVYDVRVRSEPYRSSSLSKKYSAEQLNKAYYSAKNKGCCFGACMVVHDLFEKHRTLDEVIKRLPSEKKKIFFHQCIHELIPRDEQPLDNLSEEESSENLETPPKEQPTFEKVSSIANRVLQKHASVIVMLTHNTRGGHAVLLHKTLENELYLFDIQRGFAKSTADLKGIGSLFMWLENRRDARLLSKVTAFFSNKYPVRGADEVYFVTIGSINKASSSKIIQEINNPVKEENIMTIQIKDPRVGLTTSRGLDWDRVKKGSDSSSIITTKLNESNVESMDSNTLEDVNVNSLKQDSSNVQKKNRCTKKTVLIGLAVIFGVIAIAIAGSGTGKVGALQALPLQGQATLYVLGGLLILSAAIASARSSCRKESSTRQPEPDVPAAE